MKKLLTTLIFSFIMFSLIWCTQTENISQWVTQKDKTEEKWQITTPGVEKKSYSNWFTQ